MTFFFLSFRVKTQSLNFLVFYGLLVFAKTNKKSHLSNPANRLVEDNLKKSRFLLISSLIIAGEFVKIKKCGFKCRKLKKEKPIRPQILTLQINFDDYKIGEFKSGKIYLRQTDAVNYMFSWLERNYQGILFSHT